jgi:hypothetical protein
VPKKAAEWQARFSERQLLLPTSKTRENLHRARVSRQGCPPHHKRESRHLVTSCSAIWRLNHRAPRYWKREVRRCIGNLSPICHSTAEKKRASCRGTRHVAGAPNQGGYVSPEGASAFFSKLVADAVSAFYLLADNLQKARCQGRACSALVSPARGRFQRPSWYSASSRTPSSPKWAFFTFTKSQEGRIMLILRK